MSEYSIDLRWKSDGAPLQPGKYSPNHLVDFGNGMKATMTSAPDYGGDPKYANPEQAIAAALSSCHMMTFLALAAKSRWPVASYNDEAVATLGKLPDGRTKVASITLHPAVDFADDFNVSREDMEAMHERAHRYCFVANALDLDMKVVVR